MKKHYSAPTLITQEMKLGVFGDYGNGGGDNDETPVKIIEQLHLRME